MTLYSLLYSFVKLLVTPDIINLLFYAPMLLFSQELKLYSYTWSIPDLAFFTKTPFTFTQGHFMCDITKQPHHRQSLNRSRLSNHSLLDICIRYMSKTTTFDTSHALRPTYQRTRHLATYPSHLPYPLYAFLDQFLRPQTLHTCPDTPIEHPLDPIPTRSRTQAFHLLGPGLGVFRENTLQVYLGTLHIGLNKPTRSQAESQQIATCKLLYWIQHLDQYTSRIQEI